MDETPPCPQAQLSSFSYRAGTGLFCPAVHKWPVYPQPLVLQGLTYRRPRMMPQNVHRGKSSSPRHANSVDSTGISREWMATLPSSGALRDTMILLWIVVGVIEACLPVPGRPDDSWADIRRVLSPATAPCRRCFERLSRQDMRCERRVLRRLMK